MLARTVVLLLLVICFYFKSIYCIKVIPDRTTLTYMNKKYFKEITLSVRRSSRRGDYVFNMVAESTVTIGNNVSVHIVLFEHSTKFNQYVPTFIEFHYKACDLIYHDKIFGSIVRSRGLTQCPVPPHRIEWMNLTLPTEFNVPIPFVKGKSEAKLKSETANELMVSADIIFTIQHPKPKG